VTVCLIKGHVVSGRAFIFLRNILILLLCNNVKRGWFTLLFLPF